jgi:23S rRNA pseudouridine1911/1915/1917 synthase
MELSFHTGPHEEGERLDRVLAARVPGLSRMRLRQALDEGCVLVAGVARAAGWRLRAGDPVTVSLDLDLPTAMTPEPIPLHVYYEDAELLVAEKPAGMVVHPAGRHRSGTLANALAWHFNVAGRAVPPIRAGLVHRLDRATSGLMAIAKTQRALSRLTIQFQRKQVEKRYLALVHGVLTDDEGGWEAPIGFDPEALPRWGIREDGRRAESRYRVRKRFAEHTLVELEPITGRTNQLRLHAAHFGHPIAGDELFGRGAEPGLERLFLHAYRLEFSHPADGRCMAFEGRLPDVLNCFLRERR